MYNDEVWIEAVYDNYKQAIAEGNYSLVKDIIEDVKNEGFDNVAKTMEQLLKEETLDTFLYQSPYGL